MVDQPKRPIPECYWVRPGALLAGEYPGHLDALEAQAKVRRLVAAGVTCFLDLTEDGELIPYEPLLQAKGPEAPALEYRRIPIRDMDTPTVETMRAILDLIDARIAAGHVVYVHCWGGIGRTGTVVGCYLVRDGMAGPEALAEITRLRKDTPDGWVASPQTTAQRRMVLTWHEHEQLSGLKA